MRKIVIISMLLFFIIWCSFAENEEKPVITVLNFQTTDVSESEMITIIDSLSSALFQTGKFVVIDINQRDALLEEMEFSVSELADESRAIEIGKMLSARGVVMGSLSKIEGKYIISVKLIETETAKTLGTADGKFASLAKLIDGLPSIAKKLAGISNRKAVLKYTFLGSGIVLAGAGGFCFINGLLILTDVRNAWNTYNSLSGGTQTEYDTAYDDYITKFENAESSYANLQFIGGAIATGAGVILLGTSVVLLLSPDKSSAQKTEINPVSFSVFPHNDTIMFQLVYTY